MWLVCVCVGVWLCPSHHCDECNRTATLSCAFCPTAFCSEHHLNNMRLTEYYQLACLKHKDVVLCEDPSVLKVFGLTKAAKMSSRKPPRRKSGDDVKRIRTGESGDGKLDPASKNHTERLKRKSSTPLSEPRERSLKRSCRDRDVKKMELGHDASTGDFSARLGKSTDDDLKRRDKKKELQSLEEHHRPCTSETGRKRSHKSDDKTAHHSTVAQSSERSKKRSKTSDPFADRDCHQRSVCKENADAETAQTDEKNSATFIDDGSQRRTRKQDVNHSVQKHRQIQDSELANRSAAASLSFLSAAKGHSVSALVSGGLSGATGMDVWSTAKSAVKSAESLVDEPLFDNSDDEFPELVIDVPTV